MNCQRIQPHLLDFSTGRLDASRAREVAGHLARCALCRGLLERENQTAALLSGIARPRPHRDAWPAIEAGLRTPAIPPRPRALGWRPFLWVGSMAAAGGLALSLAAPAIRAPIAAPEPEPLRALAPRAAAGLVPERAGDPLLALQQQTDRALDRLVSDGS